MRWIPKTEGELQQALEQGLLGESHHFDLKKMPAQGKSANKGIAIDLASFAVDGGAIVFGVDEASAQLTPFELAGFRERVDQIARSLVDEPLTVRVEELPSGADPKNGYAVVVVPESPSAPHMVDGRYRGRGDTTNVMLSDAEVVRLHARRSQRRAAIEDLVRSEIDRDPAPPEHRTQAHMFVVAEPVSSRRQMLLEAIGDENPTKWIMEKVIHGRPSVTLVDQWSPDLSIVSTVSRAADGWSAHSSYLQPGRQPSPEADEDDYFEVELHENGAIRLYCSRASVSHAHRDGPGRVAFETLIGGLTYRAVLIAEVISDACGHYGSWDLGLAVTNLKGAISWKATQSLSGYGVPFSSDEYLEVAGATADEIGASPVDVTQRLFGRLNRALNHGSIPLPLPVS